jgi:hypothetical protein
MSETIAHCGLDCSEYKAFKATQPKDIEWKKQTAEHWSDQDDTRFRPEDPDCHGCKSDMISFAENSATSDPVQKRGRS